MDEKELLKKAFKYGNVPSYITYCFTERKRLRVYTLHNSFTFALGNKFKRIG